VVLEVPHLESLEETEESLLIITIVINDNREETDQGIENNDLEPSTIREEEMIIMTTEHLKAPETSIEDPEMKEL
jgi:hypothetical protein